MLAKLCVLALEEFFICDNCYASQSFPSLKILPVVSAVLHKDSRSLPLDKFHLVNVPETYWLLPFCQELSGAEGTTGKDRVWLARGRVCKLVATYWPAFCFYKWKGSHDLDFLAFLEKWIDFSLLLRGYNHLEQDGEAALTEQNSPVRCSPHHCLVTFVLNLLIFFIKGQECLVVPQSLAQCVWSLRFIEWRSKADSAFPSQDTVPLGCRQMGCYHLIQTFRSNSPSAAWKASYSRIGATQSSLCLVPSAQASEPRLTTTCKPLLRGHAKPLLAGTEEPPVTDAVREVGRGAITALTFCWPPKGHKSSHLSYLALSLNSFPLGDVKKYQVFPPCNGERNHRPKEPWNDAGARGRTPAHSEHWLEMIFHCVALPGVRIPPLQRTRESSFSSGLIHWQ